MERVYRIAVKMAEEESADMEIVALAALLHDADDYKLFGEESAQNLTNAKKIMRQNNVGEEMSSRVCEIIRTMGYSKALKGIRPQTLEGQIVSDADMLEAIGAMGLVRCLAYALDKCHSGTNQIFDEKIWPEVNLSAEEYKKPNRVSDNFVNHFFEKMLKLKTMMFTKSGRKEAEIRHRFMVDFLYEFFRENNAGEWIEYLKNFENERAA
ncbi:MAG: HD domain-containing protein [Alphaproteobacteria bacterium]